MKVIVFEGPDEAGKTTLINATALMLDNVGRPFTVVKSPAGTQVDWNTNWNRWSDSQAMEQKVEDAARHVFLLDRTPEISEFVYGILRARTRLAKPLEALHNFRLGQKMMVLCLPTRSTLMEGEHRDPYGNEVGYRVEGQRLLYLAIHQLYSSIATKDFQYFRWDRYGTHNDMWAHYLVAVGQYLNLTPTDLKTTFMSDPDQYFPKKEKVE